MPAIIALISGLLFGMGLAISEMLNPKKVLNFLDIFGQWDPSLLLVMLSAVTLYLLCYFGWVKRRNKPLCTEKFYFPSQHNVDERLIIGSILFGIGWGLAGICPGPAIANLLSGQIKIIGFALAMFAGMIVANRLPSLKKS